MSVEVSTVARWDGLYADERHRLRYPSEHVVRFLAGLGLARLSSDRFFGRALDIGCGSGRHSFLLADAGFSVDAVDSSPEAVALVLPHFNAVCADMTDLPVSDDTFDVAVAYGVFYYGSSDDADAAVEELFRVLKPGGHGFVCVRTRDDWRQDHTRDGVFELAGEPEDGMLLDFIDEAELRDIYAPFGRVSYEVSEWSSCGRDRWNSDWLITVTK